MSQPVNNDTAPASTIPPAERPSVAAICVLAALADGSAGERERAELRTIIAGLDDGSGQVRGVFERVSLGEIDTARAAAGLASDSSRRIAYEMAVSLCDADGVSSPAEKQFLESLARSLNLPVQHALAARQQADELVTLDLAPVATGAAVVGAGAGAAAVGAAVGAVGAAVSSAADEARVKEIDASVMKYSILTAALELLPQSLATTAIIPLQMKMTYEIGKRYGYSLDRGHITDFLATVGVGATGQVLEGLARKFLGGLARQVGGSVLGGLAGTLVRGATGPALTFATTYALGQAARAYYAGGRKFSAVDLRTMFAREADRAKDVYERVRPQVEQQARSVNVSNLLQAVRG
ncbi:MAG: TerB family tellurite resistance protein [Planctomycetota bacterium]|nr:TerB family tellurite resistance protein [Planctomycetota bacterium]